MKRDACKFFSGSFAAMAYAHVAYAVAVSSGVMTEPVFLGRRWSVKYAWGEAAVYSAVSLALAYAGWVATPEDQRPRPVTAAADGQSGRVVTTANPAQPAPR